MNLIKQRQRGIWYKKTIIAGALIVKLIFSNDFMFLAYIIECIYLHQFLLVSIHCLYF